MALVSTPRQVYEYWRQTGECPACWQTIKHEIHLYNHWKRHHSDTAPTQINLFGSQSKGTSSEAKPRYWVWFQDKWVPVQMHVALAAMFHHRCVAVSKPQTQSKEARA